MLPSELQSLLEQYLHGAISDPDFKRLWKTLGQKGNDAEWFRATESVLANEAKYGLCDQNKVREALVRIKARIPGKEELSPGLKHSFLPVYFLRNSHIRHAAAILIVCGASIFVFNAREKHKPPVITKKVERVVNDVDPGGEKALLTLADGTTIVLDSLANGKIAQQGNVQVIKLANGQLKYQVLDNKNTGNIPVTNNTMSTPRGGQYQLQLPDGSNVWLNAESSITYPIAFAGNEREVTISGEVYFEVAKDKNKPFRVFAGDLKVEVLGTHFNINAYADEGSAKTSLLEGSVKIDREILQPGQAYVNGKVIATDVEHDVAWKNGVFNFNDRNLSQIMRQLARWYNLEVAYPQGVPKKEYIGEIGRNLSLAQVLKGLENSGVRFELEGRRLIVKP